MTDDNMLPPNDDEFPAAPDDFDDIEPPQPPKDDQAPGTPEEEDSGDIRPRLERLGGEPAPDITPEEFARLQQAGQIHIDPRGRVRTTQRNDSDAGISLRKRRAWYV